MAGYRRLISYIYAYEGEEKGKNIGFAKLEARNGQCRLSINVKKIYAGGNDMGVYLLSSGQEIFLGNIFIRNGSGDFRTCVNVENVMGTGCSMDSCIGLVIHEKGEDWRIYKTVWEDAVAQAAELEFAEVTSEKKGDLDELLKKHIEGISYYPYTVTLSGLRRLYLRLQPQTTTIFPPGRKTHIHTPLPRPPACGGVLTCLIKIYLAQLKSL